MMAAMVGLPDGRGDRIRYDYSPESPPVVVFAMPTLQQCKRIFWKPLLNLLTNHPVVEDINRSNYTIRFKQSSYYRPDIICVGLNDQDGDRARGLRIAHFAGDEIQDVKRGIFDEVIVPAMADTVGSTALLTGTPKGKVNHLFDLYNRANDRDDWSAFHFITLDNDTLPDAARKEIERSRLVLPPRIYRQEHEASFEDFPGQIFDHLSPSAKTNSIPENFDATILGVDWGDVNPALVAVGVKGDVFYVLESWYPDTGNNVLGSEHLAQAAEMVRRWGIRYAYCGHDRPASIELWNKHLRGCRVQQAFISVSEGNDYINGLLYANKLRLRSPQSDALYERMAGYHRRQDKNGNFLDEPAPGQIDHDVDCTRYACSSWIHFNSSRGQAKKTGLKLY